MTHMVNVNLWGYSFFDLPGHPPHNAGLCCTSEVRKLSRRELVTSHLLLFSVKLGNGSEMCLPSQLPCQICKV